MRKAGWIAVGVLAAIASVLLLRRLLTTDRDRVKRVVSRLAHHVERRDAGSFCLLLAEDYTDSHGHNRAALRERLTQGLPFFESISIRVEDLRIEVTGDEAVAEFVANCFARGRNDERGWRWKTPVRLFLKRRGREWRAVTGEYRLPGRVMD